MPYLEVGDARVYYEDFTGERTPPVVLLHSFPFDGTVWRPQQTALSAAGFRVIVPDLRGQGRSTSPPGPIPMEAMASDVIALLDHLGVERAAFVGLSMGGYAAFALFRQAPERVAALVLADTRAEADSDEARQARFENVALARRDGMTALADRLLKKQLTPRAPLDLVVGLHGRIAAAPLDGTTGALEGMAARPDSTDLLPRMTAPTLVLAGSDDELTPPDGMRKLAGALPDARFEVIDGAGHLSNQERPEAFNAALLGFLERLA